MRPLVAACVAIACGGARPAPAPAPPAAPAVFSFRASDLRPVVVTPLNHRGEPTPCVTGADQRPCDIELTADRTVYYRSFTPAIAAHIGPDLALRRPHAGDPVFSLELDGTLSGPGLFRAPDSVQVLHCRMTAEPALECEHRFPPATASRVWNEENCKHAFTARVDGGSLVVTFAAFPDVPAPLAARVEPAPTDAAGRGLALFLWAMELIARDTETHTPHVVDMQVP